MAKKNMLIANEWRWGEKHGASWVTIVESAGKKKKVRPRLKDLKATKGKERGGNGGGKGES